MSDIGICKQLKLAEQFSATNLLVVAVFFIPMLAGLLALFLWLVVVELCWHW